MQILTAETLLVALVAGETYERWENEIGEIIWTSNPTEPPLGGTTTLRDREQEWWEVEPSPAWPEQPGRQWEQQGLRNVIGQVPQPDNSRAEQPDEAVFPGSNNHIVRHGQSGTAHRQRDSVRNSQTGNTPNASPSPEDVDDDSDERDDMSHMAHRSPEVADADPEASGPETTKRVQKTEEPTGSRTPSQKKNSSTSSRGTQPHFRPAQALGGALLPGRADSLLGHFHGPHFGMIDHATLPRRPPVKGSHSVEGTFLWAVGLFGSVENGAVVLTAVFSRKFKKPLHMLVGTLATTDLFISLIYIPSYTYFLLEGDTNFVNEPLPPGEIAKDEESRISASALGGAGAAEDADSSRFSFCNVSRSIFVEIASVTLTIKALIALYLYVLTRSREFARQLFSPRNTLIFIGIAWGINFVMLFLPSFLGHGKVDFYPNEFVCLSRGEAPPDATSSDETLTFVYSFTALAVHAIELTLICACFVKVHHAITRGKLYSNTHRQGANEKEARINYARASKITILVFASFVLCWLPIYVINMVDPEHEKLPDYVHHLVMDLLLLKSAINPTIYIYGIRSLRHEMRLVCMCKCRLDEKTAKQELARALRSSSSSFGNSKWGKSTALAEVV